MSEPKLSKYAQKVAKRNTLAAAFQRVEEQKREALPEQVERKKAQPPPPRSAVADLGEMPSKAGDVPCNAECHNRLCFYELYGTCTDNAPCERQMDADGNLTHKEEN